MVYEFYVDAPRSPTNRFLRFSQIFYEKKNQEYGNLEWAAAEGPPRGRRRRRAGAADTAKETRSNIKKAK